MRDFKAPEILLILGCMRFLGRSRPEQYVSLLQFVESEIPSTMHKRSLRDHIAAQTPPCDWSRTRVSIVRNSLAHNVRIEKPRGEGRATKL